MGRKETNQTNKVAETTELIHNSYTLIFLECSNYVMFLQVLRCSNIAVVKVAETTELIQKALENDRLER